MPVDLIAADIWYIVYYYIIIIFIQRPIRRPHPLGRIHRLCRILAHLRSYHQVLLLIEEGTPIPHHFPFSLLCHPLIWSGTSSTIQPRGSQKQPAVHTTWFIAFDGKLSGRRGKKSNKILQYRTIFLVFCSLWCDMWWILLVVGRWSWVICRFLVLLSLILYLSLLFSWTNCSIWMCERF